MKIHYFYILLLFILISCGDNIKTEKDKYPDIPEFPQFKDNVFISQHITKMVLNPAKFKRSTENYFNLKYAVKDSSIYLVTNYNDAEFPEINALDDKYYFTLVRIDNGKVTLKKEWTDSDFTSNFWIKPNNDLIIGKRSFSSNEKYQNSKKTDSIKIDSLKYIQFKNIGELFDTEEKVNFKKFDSVVIDSKGKLGGGVNSGFDYKYSAVYLHYYKLTWKNKKSLTKIDERWTPFPYFIPVKNKLYCITYNEDTNLNGKLQKEYKIEVMK